MAGRDPRAHGTDHVRLAHLVGVSLFVSAIVWATVRIEGIDAMRLEIETQKSQIDRLSDRAKPCKP